MQSSNYWKVLELQGYTRIIIKYAISRQLLTEVSGKDLCLDTKKDANCIFDSENGGPSQT